MRIKSIASVVLVLALFAVILSACAGGGGGGGAPAEPNTVTMKNIKYDPATITVKAGTTVTFVHKDAGQIHDVKFKEGSNSPDVMNENDKWTRTFDKAGTFEYVCTYHTAEGMIGKVIVQ